MGNSCSRRKMTTLYGELANGNTNKVNELICEAIKRQWQPVLIVDDYTSIHRKRRPKTDQMRQPKSMCAIVIKVFKNVKAVSKCVPITYHSIDGIEINFCVQTVSCPSSMYKLGFSYSSIMRGWVRDIFLIPNLRGTDTVLHSSTASRLFVIHCKNTVATLILITPDQPCDDIVV